jgi:hypothetical protein
MSNRVAYGVLAVAALAAVAWVALRPPETPDASGAPQATAAVRPASADVSKLSASAVLAIDPRANPLRPARAIQVKHTLFNEYLGTKQYKALYDRLKGLPEGQTAEGRLVLYDILKTCATVTDRRGYAYKPPQTKREDFIAGIGANDPQRERRIAAFDDFTANRCVGLEGVTIAQSDLDKLLADSAAAGDPRARAMAIEQDLMATRRNQGRDGTTLSDGQIETLKQSLSSLDPEAIRVAGRVLSNSWGDYALRIGPDQQPVEPRAFMNAWLVLSCEYGAPCGADTPRLQQACAYQGHCNAQSYPDYLYYYGSSPYDSQMLVQYSIVLRNVLQTGDWSQLNVVRCLPPPPNPMTFVPGPR